MSHKPSYYSSLSLNMIVTVIVVSFAPLILVLGVVLEHYSVLYEAKAKAHLVEVVQKHRQSIDSFLNEKSADIHFVAASFSLEQVSDPDVLKEILDKLREQFGTIFVDLGVVNAEGRQIAYAGPYNLAGADYSDADWFHHSRKSRHYISDVFLGLRHSPHFIIAVRNGNGGEPWTLRATIDFLAFSDLVESVHIGETGAAFILNRDGVFQTRPPESTDASERLKALALDRLTATQDRPRAVEARENESGDHLLVTAPMKGGDWVLILRQKSADAFSGLILFQRVTLAIFAVGGVGIVLMAVILSRKMVARIQRADEEKETMNDQIIESGRLAAIGELAAGVAHEINNPVAIMIEEAGWMEDLLEIGDAAKDDYKEFRASLRMINRQGSRCKEITHKLLSFARKADVEKQLVDMNALASEILGLFQQSAGYSNIKVTTQLCDTTPYVEASMSELQQELLNLMNNSLQAMAHVGGAIEISTGKVGGNVIISVYDTGPGIPPANLRRIFDPFFTTKPVGKGTGLGLSICYGIIQRMGGRIDAESRMGEWTRFTISLPEAHTPEDAGLQEGEGDAIQEDKEVAS